MTASILLVLMGAGAICMWWGGHTMNRDPMAGGEIGVLFGGVLFAIGVFGFVAVPIMASIIGWWF